MKRANEPRFDLDHRMNVSGTLRNTILATAVSLVLAACGQPTGPVDGTKVVILGIDGMDWGLINEMMSRGEMPNFSRLAEQGMAQPLGTSVPPLSPVAWSDFTTGLDSGGHGIFDFIHRDPETKIPYLSTSEQTEDGGYRLLRHGQPFWERLEERGIETSILRMPANFPPTGTATREISGMGTPDLLGTYGTFSYYTTEFDAAKVDGGDVYQLRFFDNKAEGKLYGPDAGGERISVDFELFVDPQEPVAKLVVEEQELILNVGDWSDWIEVAFPVPLAVDLKAIARVYLKAVDPDVKLYVSPLNFDPMHRHVPGLATVDSNKTLVSHPENFARDLAKATGRFYTQGMPEETKALSERVLTRPEFLQQAKITGDELREQYKYVLDTYNRGLLFYYFGNIDLTCHMMWHTLDETHPHFNPETDFEYRNVIYDLYKDADRLVGETLEKVDDDTTVVVMSDHGFASWRRTFHLNSWLRENGYLVVKDPNRRGDKLFSNVDWAKTRAYGLGLNGLYINLRGRERGGIVSERERRELMDEIETKLLAAVDPESDTPSVTKVYQRERFFKDRGYLEIGPDIVVGYAKGTKGADESALGEELNAEIHDFNDGEWTGDHGMDHETVPGILFANRPLKREVKSLKDLAGAILAEFGIEDFPSR